MTFVVKSMGYVVYMQTTVREKRMKYEAPKLAARLDADYAKKVTAEAEAVFKEVNRGAELWSVAADGSASRLK